MSNVLVIRSLNGFTGDEIIGVVEDVPSDPDAQDVVQDAYDASEYDREMPGEHKLYEVGSNCSVVIDA